MKKTETITITIILIAMVYITIAFYQKTFDPSYWGKEHINLIYIFINNLFWIIVIFFNNFLQNK